MNTHSYVQETFGDVDLSMVTVTAHSRILDEKLIFGDIFDTQSVSLTCK